MRYRLPIISVLILFAACRPDTYTPKPRGYYQVDLPRHAYQKFDTAGFPYSFEYPVYGRVIHEINVDGMKADNPYWIDIDFPSLGGRIYLSYKAIDAAHPFDRMLNDSHELSYYHSKKADYINAPEFHHGKDVFGIFYTVGGNAASKYQFFATDSVKHFLRGALYFDVTPNADSLQPVNDFLKKDIEHLLGTLEWR